MLERFVKVLACLVIAFSLTSPVLAMEHHTSVLVDNRGNALKDATVYVYNAGTTTPATIFSDNGVTLKANPFTTSNAANSPGAYDFYATNGVYDIVFSKAGYSFDPKLTRRIALFDVNDGGGGGGGGPSAFADLTTGTNITAAMLVGPGASLSYSGAGSINASLFRGNSLIPLGDGGTNQSSWTANRCVRVNAGGTGLEAAGSDCSLSTPSFSALTTGSNTTATMTVGTGGVLTFSGSGSINASTYKGNATVAVADGGTGVTSSVDDSVLLGNGSAWQVKVIPSCLDSIGQHLNYDPSTNTFGCGTSSSGGGGAFSALTSGTNTTAAMVVSTGSSLSYSGGGTINASSFRGNTLISVLDGGTGLSVPTEDGVMIGNGSAWQIKTLPDCNNPVTSKLLYDFSTNLFSCGTDQSSGGGTTFDSIGSGTNTTATMTVGSGATITPTGTGSVVATSRNPTLVTVNAGNSPYSVATATGIIFCDTTSASRTITLPAATSRKEFTVYNLGANACTINRTGIDTITTGIQSGLSTFTIRNPGSNFWFKSDENTVWYVGG